MEGDGKLFGEIIKEGVLAPFIEAREALREAFQEQAPPDPDGKYRLELADSIEYTEDDGRFYQIHPGIPQKNGSGQQILRIRMEPADINKVTESIKDYLNGN